MPGSPTVTVSLDKSTYAAGDVVHATFTVVSPPASSVRQATWIIDDVGGTELTGTVNVTVTAPPPATWVLEDVRWADTGVAWQLTGLTADGLA